MLIIIFQDFFNLSLICECTLVVFFCTKIIIIDSFADKCTANNALCTYIKFKFF